MISYHITNVLFRWYLYFFHMTCICSLPESLSARTGRLPWRKMALPMIRGCYRLPFSFTRLFLSESIYVNRSGKTRLPSSSPAAVAAAARPYSSERGGQRQQQKVVVVGIPNPFIWFRTRIYYFLIRAYFDKEFNIEEFTEGAKQVCKNLPTNGEKVRFVSKMQLLSLLGNDFKWFNHFLWSVLCWLNCQNTLALKIWLK